MELSMARLIQLIVSMCMVANCYAQTDCTYYDVTYDSIVQEASPKSGNNFGTTTAQHGEWAAVSAPFDDKEYKNAGSVTIFKYIDGELTKTQVIYPPEKGTTGNFGATMSMTENWLAIALPKASFRGKNSGAVYVYRLNDSTDEFELFQKFYAPHESDDDLYGSAVVIISELDEVRLAIGAPGDDDVDKNSGAVYMYNYVHSFESFKLEQKLLNTNTRTSENEYMGESIVALRLDYFVFGIPKSKYEYDDSDNRIIGRIVTALRHTSDGLQDGAKYTVGSLYNLVVERTDYAKTIDTDGYFLFVGDPSYSDSVSNGGRIIAFKFLPAEPVVETITIERDNPVQNERFGDNFVAKDGKLFVLNPSYDSGKGKVEMFWYNTATLKWEMQDPPITKPSSLKSKDYFGTSVLAFKDHLYIAAPGDDTKKSGSGALFAYTKDYACDTKAPTPSPIEMGCDSWENYKVEGLEHLPLDTGRTIDLSPANLHELKSRSTVFFVFNFLAWVDYTFDLFSIESETMPNNFMKVYVNRESNIVVKLSGFESIEFSGFELYDSTVVTVTVQFDTSSISTSVQNEDQTGHASSFQLERDHGAGDVYLPYDETTKLYITKTNQPAPAASLLQLYIRSEPFAYLDRPDTCIDFF